MKILCPVFFPGWSEAHRARDFKTLMHKYFKIEVTTMPFYSRKNTPWDEHDAYYIKLGSPTIQRDWFTDEIMSKTVNHVGSMSESPLPGANTIIAANARYYELNKHKFPNKYLYKGSKFETLRIPIDTDLFRPYKRPYENKDFIIGWAGNVLNWKKMFKIIQELDSLPGITIVCSNGDLHGNGIPNEYLRYYYALVDCVVQTSLEEGAGCIILEGASCGKPIVAFDVGSAPELLEGREGGIIVKKDFKSPTLEQIQEFKDSVLMLANNRDMAKAMGESNRKFMVEEWNQLEEWRKVFGKVISG